MQICGLGQHWGALQSGVHERQGKAGLWCWELALRVHGLSAAETYLQTHKVCHRPLCTFPFLLICSVSNSKLIAEKTDGAMCRLILKQLGIDKEPDNWANVSRRPPFDLHLHCRELQPLIPRCNAQSCVQAIEGQLDTLQTVTQDAPAEHQRHAKEPAKKKPAPKKKVNIEKGKAPDGGNPSLQMKGRKLPASLQ